MQKAGRKEASLIFVSDKKLFEVPDITQIAAAPSHAGKVQSLDLELPESSTQSCFSK